MVCVGFEDLEWTPRSLFATGCVPCPVLDPPSARSSHRTSWPRPKPSFAGARSASNSDNGPTWSSCCTSNPSSRIPRPPAACNSTPTPSEPGGNAGPRAISPWRTSRDGVASPFFPPGRGDRQGPRLRDGRPDQVAPEPPIAGRPGHASPLALGKPISRSTVWRILDADAIKPWRYEHWIFPRDPRFAEKAGRVLDLYAGLWQGQRLGPEGSHPQRRREDEHPGPASAAMPASAPPRAGRSAVEHEYERGGALQYLAAWDVRRGSSWGAARPRRGSCRSGGWSSPGHGASPISHGRRGCSGSWTTARRIAGETSVQAVGSRPTPTAILVHMPVHASWLNQVEIYFSMVQRKVLTPNDFAGLEEVE